MTGAYAAPFDIGTHGLTVRADVFTVSGDAITSADYQAFTPNNANFVLLLNSSGSYNIAAAQSLQYAYNTNGFSGVTYTLEATETTSTPEPVSVALLVSGLVGLGFVRRRRA